MDDGRSEIERRLAVIAVTHEQIFGGRSDTAAVLREAAGRIGEARRVLDLLIGPPLDAAGVVELIGLAMALRAELGGEMHAEPRRG